MSRRTGGVPRDLDAALGAEDEVDARPLLDPVAEPGLLGRGSRGVADGQAIGDDLVGVGVETFAEQVAHLRLGHPVPGIQADGGQGAAHPYARRNAGFLLRLAQALTSWPTAVPDRDLTQVIPVRGALTHLLERHHATQPSTRKHLVSDMSGALP